MSDSDSPKIHIDSDWKAQAQAEKEKLAAQSSQPADAADSADAGGLPPASLESLISMLASQALLALGAIPDPRSGQRYLSLDLARHYIDLLTVIEQKTKGNLDEQEQDMVSGTLYELRQRYIHMASSAATAAGGKAANPGEGRGPDIVGA
jgi:hypothetical protein